MTLDELDLRKSAEITAIDWGRLSDVEGRRLRALGLDVGVVVEKLHQGILFFRCPIALKVGRMRIAIRREHARAIQIAASA